MVSWNKWQAIIAAITTFLLGLTFWITRSAVIEARNTTRAAVDAARAAEEQVRLSREALIAEERAWIFVEIAIESGFAISETEISIKVAVDVRNIGKTPALEVYTTLRLVPATQYGQDQIKALYAEVRGKKDHHPRGVLLAGEAYKRDWEVSLSKADLGVVAGATGLASPALIGCVTYQLWPEKSVHQTGFFYDLFEDTEKGGVYLDRGSGPAPSVLYAVRPGGFAD